ncbi:MAG: hypothetical protein ACJ761_03470 [Chloroflexota bacterium]
MTDRPAGEPDAIPPESEMSATTPDDATEVFEDRDLRAADGGTDPADEPDREAEDADDPEPAEGEPDDTDGDTQTVEEDLAPVAAGAAAAGAAAEARRGLRRGTAQPARAATPSELAVQIKDRPSRIFVIATVVTFAAILLYGILGGRGGVITGVPRPRPTASPLLSASPAASASAAPSGSTSPSGSASPSGSTSPSGSAGASGSASTAPSGSASLAP